MLKSINSNWAGLALWVGCAYLAWVAPHTRQQEQPPLWPTMMIVRLPGSASLAAGTSSACLPFCIWRSLIAKSCTTAVRHRSRSTRSTTISTRFAGCLAGWQQLLNLGANDNNEPKEMLEVGGTVIIDGVVVRWSETTRLRHQPTLMVLASLLS